MSPSFNFLFYILRFPIRTGGVCIRGGAPGSCSGRSCTATSSTPQPLADSPVAGSALIRAPAGALVRRRRRQVRFHRMSPLLPCSSVYLLTDMDVCIRWCSARLAAAARLGMQGRRWSSSGCAELVLFEIWICGVKLKREDFCKQCAVMKTEILCMK